MAQHFLVSPKSRKLSLIDIMLMDDEEVFSHLKMMRWSKTNGEPVCPECGTIGKCYDIRTRKQLRCKECFKTFSITSGTIFASYKLSLKAYLIAVVIFANSSKSISAIQLSRLLGVNYKTAWSLNHKMRESLFINRPTEPLSGVCEIDGVYVNYYIRPKNFKHNRIDRRKEWKKKYHLDKKRVIISIRQRHHKTGAKLGAVKTRTFIVKEENYDELKPIIYNTIEKDSEVHVDANGSYGDFIARYDLKIVNHSEEYSGVFKENNNQCESFNARFRRMQRGNLHKLGLLYLSNYANEIAYREDTRRWDNKQIYEDILQKCLNTSNEDSQFCGYRHKVNRRKYEILGLAA